MHKQANAKSEYSFRQSPSKMKYAHQLYSALHQPENI